MLKRLLLLIILIFLSACSNRDSDSENTLLPATSTLQLPSPALIAPADERMTGYHVPVVLEWSWDRPLAENQVYSVQIAGAGEPLQDIQWTADTRYDVSWFAQSGGAYDWQILVIQLANGAYEKTLAASPVQQFTIPRTSEELIQTFSPPDTSNYPNDCSIVPETTTEKEYLGLDAPYHGLTADGVYLFNYADYSVFQEAGWQAVPYHIGNYARLGFSAWCSFDDPYGLVMGLKQADWYVENAVDYGDFATWHYTFANPEFGLYEYWTSAFGNSNAIYTLTYAYAITGEQKYKDMAQKAVNSFLVTMDKNGVSSLMDDGESLLFEETAGPGVAGSRVLNVHLLSIRALDFYANYTGDETAKNLVEMGIETVRKYLPDFDVETMSLYALGPQPQRSNSRFLFYHEQYITELLRLYEYTQDAIFLEYALRWQRYLFEPYPADTYLNRVSEENLILQAPETLDTKAGYSVDAQTTEAVIFDLKTRRPIRSFGFDFILTHGRSATYPTAYTISVSDDGETWREMLQEENHEASEDNHLFEDVTGRYVRFGFDEFADENADELIIGVTRIDGTEYWQKPVFIASSNTIYGDIREKQPVTALEFSVTDTLEIWIEVSDDMQDWTPLIPENRPVMFSGELELPADEWQYFKIHSAGTVFPAISQLTIRN